MSHIASDNNVFLEFHPRFFCIKDLDSRNILLKGPHREGFYPLPATTLKKLVFGVNKMAGGAIKLSIDMWHSRLGHPTITIVQRVIRNFDLPCLVQEEKDSVCSACQQAKSHQLQYPKSTSRSSKSLELVFFLMFGVQPLNLLVVISIT
jgi:hypothetical protein